MRKRALYWQILIGMLLGVLLGLVLSQFGWGSQFVQDWIKPFSIFIAAQADSYTSHTGFAYKKNIRFERYFSALYGFKTIALYILTTLIAVSVGLTVVNTIAPGKHIAEETRTDLVTRYASDATQKQADAQRQRDSGPLQALEDIVPDNIFNAAANNTNMLQVIFFAIFFGIGILIPENKLSP